MNHRSRSTRLIMCVMAACLMVSGKIHAAGELNIFNWGNYTSPELIEKFERLHDIKVSVTDYDSNDTALAKVRTGGHGFDIVVPSASYMGIWIEEGLIMKSRPDQMENYKHMDDRWVNVPWDKGHQYSVPWLWGLVGNIVNTSVYDGDINTSAIFLDPPEELIGKINVAPEMSDVMYSAIKYLGGEWCTGDKDFLRKVRDKLVEAKSKWIAMDYSAIEKMTTLDYSAAFFWNGVAMRAREMNPDIRFGYPKEGFAYFMDSVAVLSDARNPENAKLFQNFIMAPENAALISNFAKYANGIKGSEAFMSEELKNAPELNVPSEFVSAGGFVTLCPTDVNDLYTRIWTDIIK